MNGIPSTNHTFEYLQPWLGEGNHPPSGWSPLGTRPMLVMVGGMGVGKTTTVKTLARIGCVFHLLPNRRELTERLIVAPLLLAEGKKVENLHRLQRVPYIQRYRAMHPDGLAYAVSQLWIDEQKTPNWLIFDGLRGEDEVLFAINALPLARFCVLKVPEMVRLTRLLQRQDPYDNTNGRGEFEPDMTGASGFADLGVPEAQAIFSQKEEFELMGMVHRGDFTQLELADKLKLFCAERKLYNIPAAMQILEFQAPDRTISIDTQRRSPEQVAQKLLFELGNVDWTDQFVKIC